MSLSKFFTDQHRTAFLTLGVGVAGSFALYFFSRWAYQGKHQLPTEWEEVGAVAELYIYPVKSAKPISVDSAKATKDGLSHGHLLDRSFMVLTEDLHMVTGRQARKLVLLNTSFEGTTLTISSKNGDTVKVNIDDVNTNKKEIKFIMRGDPLQGVDCGDEVAEWLSKHLFNDETKVRLVYKGSDEWHRPARHFKYFKFPLFHSVDTTLYNDATSYMVVTQASLDDLNKRLETPVTMGYFRPPIVVAGTTPFDEDTWEYIKIGDNVILHMAKPCERCILTKINPNTGEQREDHFEILKSYRIPTFPEALSKSWASSPIFGLHCGIDVTGNLKVGDKVFVSRPQTPYWHVKI